MAVVGAFIMPHPPIIVPAVGRGEERGAQKTVDACRKAAREIAGWKPETIVVTSPHAVLYADYLHISPGEKAAGDFGQFGAPGEREEFRYDTEFVAELTGQAKKENLPAGTFGERSPEVDHGVLVPFSFILPRTRNFKLVRCSISGLGPLEHYRFGQCIARTAEKLNRRTVLVASGDLSHKLKEDGPYGFAKEGPVFDREVTDAMKSADFLRFLTFDPDFCDEAAECGLRSFQILAGVFDGRKAVPEFLSCEGPFGVGYSVCGFTPGGADESRRFGELYQKRARETLLRRRENEDEYVRLARLSLETWVTEGHRIEVPEDLPGELTGRRAGAFVSLKENGQLRGCIGTIGPTQKSLAEEILRNAVSAGTRDPRFDPVTREELPQLVYSVDVLGETEPIDSPKQLEPRRYGVIVRSGERCGLLLPNLAGVDTARRQIEIALGKAGISRGEPYTLERFEVVRHK